MKEETSKKWQTVAIWLSWTITDYHGLDGTLNTEVKNHGGVGLGLRTLNIN